MPFGDEAVALARAAIRSETEGIPMHAPVGDPRFGEPSGAFVTLETYPIRDLRGCIGYPMPVLPLGDAIEQAARSACHDPRFPDLEPSEVPHVTVEVTVLTVPKEVPHDSPEDLLSKIEIGRDGLIIELFGRRGLLLPQVPVEWGWDAREFLDHLSVKAGLPPDAWTSPGARISAFGGDVYSEESPGGEIIRK